MAQQSGEWSRGLAEAGTALAARDRVLAEADRALSETVADAYRIATESIRRLEGIQSEIDAVGTGAAPDARESAHLLLDRHRQIIAVVDTARSSVAVKTVELQQLSQQYTG